MKQKRRVKGKDWHGWAWWSYTDKQYVDFTWYPPYRSNIMGKWVRVKFTEIK